MASALENLQTGTDLASAAKGSDFIISVCKKLEKEELIQFDLIENHGVFDTDPKVGLELYKSGNNNFGAYDESILEYSISFQQAFASPKVLVGHPTWSLTTFSESPEEAFIACRGYRRKSFS